MNYSTEIEKMNKLISEFDEKFSQLDLASLTKEEKKIFMPMKNKIDKIRRQRDMMVDTLKTMKSFGADDIKIGK